MPDLHGRPPKMRCAAGSACTRTDKQHLAMMCHPEDAEWDASIGRTFIVDDQLIMSRMQDLFNATHQEHPTGGHDHSRYFQVEKVIGVSNDGIKREYDEQLKEIQRKTNPTTPQGLGSVSSLARSFVQQRGAVKKEHVLTYVTDLELELEKSVNEALLFHGVSEADALPILQNRVRIPEQRSQRDEPYGAGIYFAESVTRADANAPPDDTGLCCMIVSKVVLGNVLTTDAKQPDAKALLRKVNAKDFHSVCGDRRSIASPNGGWREFVIYEEKQSRPLYLVKYRRTNNFPGLSASVFSTGSFLSQSQ